VLPLWWLSLHCWHAPHASTSALGSTVHGVQSGRKCASLQDVEQVAIVTPYVWESVGNTSWGDSFCVESGTDIPPSC
jgi:hypothetical protein